MWELNIFEITRVSATKYIVFSGIVPAECVELGHWGLGFYPIVP